MNHTHTANNESFFPEVGTLLSPLTVTDVTVEGQGLARHQGRVFFLDEGLPGAVVSAIVHKVSKKAAFANIASVLSPSPYQVEPACPHAGECGGCLWQHFSLEAARQWKRNHISQCLTRIGKAHELAVAPVEPSPLSVGYRNKMSFAFGPGPDGACLLGLRKRGGREIVEVESCLLQSGPAMDILAHVRKRANELNLTAWPGNDGKGGHLRHLIVHRPDLDNGASMLVECISGPMPRGKHPGSPIERIRQLGGELMERFSLAGFIHGERIKRDELALSERTLGVLGGDAYREKIGHITLSVPHDAFLQTNTAAAERLYELIRREAALTGTEVVWDLFCGIGSIGLFLAPAAGQVHGCDTMKAGVEAARRNAESMGYANCNFYQADLALGVKADLPAPDVIIVDPPRAGLSEAFAKQLAKMHARVLLYVSCDAGTQARDVARLAEGWRPLRAFPVDMFPYTSHVENLLVLTPRYE